MDMALDEARRAAEAGDVPVGCVIVRGDDVIGRGGNEIERTGDPTRHAEIVAIAEAVAVTGDKFLADCTLYVTLEPCSMCAGAIVLARVPTIVYAATDEKTGACRSLFEIADDPRLNHRCIIRTGIRAEEAAALLGDFFATQRSGTPQAPRRSLPERSPDQRPAPALYLVPTPIGNLEDITVRGLKLLRAADIVLCEDTRHTGQLLRQYGAQGGRLVSNHEHNERERVRDVVRWVGEGKIVALVSDAGMPGISDPGYRAVHGCIDAGVPVVALPGATAAMTAAAASGLPTDALYFGGFLPQKKGRGLALERLAMRAETVILYESPHRILQLLEELERVAGSERRIVIARELSKMHEEYLRGTVAEVKAVVEARGGIKGECVVLVAGSATEE